jgi:flagellar basal body-associated protein FliL
MSRTLLAIAAVVVVAAVAFFLLWNPEGRPAAPTAGPASVGAPPTAAPVAVVPRPHAPASAEPAAPASEAQEAPAPDAAPPKGPFEIDLGRHVVHLHDPEKGRVLKVGLKITVDKPTVAREVRLRNEELVRMMFFLGSHRVADGAMGPDGQERFRQDLLDRFRNVIHDGQVEDLVFTQYEVADAPSGPAQ